MNKLLISLVLLSPGMAFASALTWSRTTIDREIPAGTPELRIEIPLRNTGTQPVTITDLQSSCGCTKLLLADKTIPAGGKGALTTVYKPGDRIGPQQSEITLKTDEPDSPATRLTLRITITPLLTLQPAMVRWVQGGGPGSGPGALGRADASRRDGRFKTGLRERFMAPASDAAFNVRAGHHQDRDPHPSRKPARHLRRICGRAVRC